MLIRNFILAFSAVGRAIANFFVHQSLRYLLYPLYLLHLHLPASLLVSLAFAPYTIEQHDFSPSALIFLTRSKSTRQRICLKVWRRHDEFCTINDKEVYVDHLLDGLQFNRMFAPGVFWGIAPIEFDSTGKDFKEVRRGYLIKNPEKKLLLRERNQDYAVVMCYLDREGWLDYQLHPQRLGKQFGGMRNGIIFLAHEVARMHRKVRRIYHRWSEHQRADSVAAGTHSGHSGTYENIAAKLDFNCSLFKKALAEYARREEHFDQEAYANICSRLKDACQQCESRFTKRYNDGCIRRCHGDLKLSNLWLQEKPLTFGQKLLTMLHGGKFSPRLLALDCVDFNLDFSHIDTLSDVAMLAVDIEVHLALLEAQGVMDASAEDLINSFLATYLEEMKENKEVTTPLLEYYMTEKAMVRALMCILCDGRHELGGKYLGIVQRHIEKLENWILERGKIPLSSYG